MTGKRNTQDFYNMLDCGCGDCPYCYLKRAHGCYGCPVPQPNPANCRECAEGKK